MCQKQVRIWTCGCTQLDDPAPCHRASSRNKVCEPYPFAWAFADPIRVPIPSPCPACTAHAIAIANKHANEAFVRASEAYPVLKEVAGKDDEHRQRQGRPRFEKEVTEDSVPPGWTSEMNRLPGNANEYSAFLSGEFDPRRRLPDTHLPEAFGAVGGERQQRVPQQISGQRGRRRRNPAPPLGWQGAVLMEGEYPSGQPQQETSERGRRPSYTGNREDKGWAPPFRGTLPPRAEQDVEPPSRHSSRQ